MKTALSFALEAFARVSIRANRCASHARAYARLLSASGHVFAVNESASVRAVAAFNEAIGSADWVRIAPFGEFPNKVGLQVFDRAAADAIVTGFNSVATKAATLFRGLPIYEGHPDDSGWLRENPGYKRVAVGRVKEVQTRDDGLYGKVAFNELGNQLVRGDAPAYEAQSPHWAMRRITHKSKPAAHPFELLSLGLTNTPNIPGTHLGLNERDQEETNSAMKTHIIALLAALGRPLANAAAVTDEQLASAVNEAVPVATSLVTASNELATVKPQLATAQGAITTAINEAATLRTSLAAERKARAEAVIAVAINEGRITQAQSPEWLGKLTAVNCNFETVATELGKVKKAVNTQSRVSGLGNRKPEEIASQNRITAINEAVTAKEKATGLKRPEAYAAVQREKPELFTNTAAE
jgi:hypothetical protein